MCLLQGGGPLEEEVPETNKGKWNRLGLNFLEFCINGVIQNVLSGLCGQKNVFEIYSCRCISCINMRQTSKLGQVK